MSTKQKAVDKEGEKDNDSISKLGFEEAKDKHFEQKIGKKFSTVIDTNPIQSSLRVGKLQIGGNVKDLRNFVYIPDKFDFHLPHNMELLFQVLGIDDPDLVFRLGMNYSVVEAPDKKTINDWQHDWRRGFESKEPEKLYLFSTEDRAHEENDLELSSCNYDEDHKERIQERRNGQSLMKGMVITHVVSDSSSHEEFSKNEVEQIKGGDDELFDRSSSSKDKQVQFTKTPPKNPKAEGENNGERLKRTELLDMKMVKESFPDPDKCGERISRVREDTRNLFSAISDFKKTVFLVTNPCGGNELSEIALETLINSRDTTVQSIGLFHSDPTEPLLDNCLSVLREEEEVTDYESEMKKRIQEERKTNDWMAFSSYEEVIDGKKQTRMPIPDEVFRHCSVLHNDAPTRKAIKVDCELTTNEMEIKKKHRGITRIPGGLAHKCDHRLVFSSKKRMQEFEFFFCDTHSTGFFACGGSYDELDISKRALKDGNPLFAIEGTGFVATVVDHFFSCAINSEISSRELNKRKSNFRKKAKQLKQLVKKKVNRVPPERKVSESIAIDELLKYESTFLRLVKSINTSIYEAESVSIGDVKDGYKICRMNMKEKGENPFGGGKIVKVPKLEVSNFYHASLAPDDEDLSQNNKGEGKAINMCLTPINIQQILRDHQYNSKDGDNNEKDHLYKILERKPLGDSKSLILVQVPGPYDVPNIETALDRAGRFSKLLQNFMDFPQREIEIAAFLDKTEVPIIAVDYDCKIMDSSKQTGSIESCIEKFEKGDNLHDLVCKNLPEKVSDHTKEAVKKFFMNSLEENINSSETFDFSIENPHEQDWDNRASIVTIYSSNTEDISTRESDKLSHLSVKCVPRVDINDQKKTLLGAYFLFHDNTIINPKLVTPLAHDRRTLDAGEVLVTSDKTAINHFNDRAYYFIRSQSDSLQLKNKISEVMATAPDRNLELGGHEKNHDAIDACEKLIREAQKARKRYSNQALFFQFVVQTLVLVTTILTVIKLHCEGDMSIGSDCKKVRNGESLISAFIIILPIVAAVFQTIIYSFRPKWKSARLMLMEKRLESEMFKFRARVGPYNAFHSKKKGSHDNVRKKFVVRCQNFYDDCVRSEFKSGTIKTNWNIYGRHIRPCLNRCRSIICLYSCRERYANTKSKRNIENTSPIFPKWFLPRVREKWRKRTIEKRIERTEEKNRDLEAAQEGNYSVHFSEEECRLLDILKHAEERRATIKRRKKESMDFQKKYSILSIDEYNRKRLVPQLKRYQTLLPRMVFCRNVLQVFIVIFTSTSTLLGAVPTGEVRLAFLIPVFLALAAFLGNLLSFFRYETVIPVLHESCIGGLKKAALEMNSPATLERRLQTQKEKVVFLVEESILSYYYFMVEDQLENGKEANSSNNQDDATGIGQDTRKERTQGPSSGDDTRGNLNNNRIDEGPDRT